MTQPVEERLDLIRELFPSLPIHQTSTKSEGQSNDVVIVNQEWVFRFSKSEAAEADLTREAKVLSVLPKFVDLKVPESDSPRPGVMRQRKLVGEPLDRATLLRQTPAVQERLVEALAHFLFQLHRVPADKLGEVGKSGAGEQAADAVELFKDCERELFPHLKDYAIEAIRKHFEPVLEGRLSLAFTPVLIHADLNPSHILWNAEHGTLAGVIDFGMAGLGDAAYDYASIILAYGESPLRRMHEHHQSIGEKIDRARFWAFAIELRLALAGIRSGDVRWFCSHLGFARDAMPIDTKW
jgi:aminoglycoside 2''-phosphotransferase